MKMCAKMKIDPKSPKTRIVGYLLLILFMLFLFFHRSGIHRVLYIFVVIILTIQVPGTTIFYFVERQLNNQALIFGLILGLANLGFFAYLFGIFSINFLYSLLFSLGIPYFILVISLIKYLRDG